MAGKRLTGIILSGGKSSRMGLEKGLVDFRGKPLISYAIEALKPVTDALLVSANNRLDDYRNFGYEIVRDKVKEIGPMGGLLAALKHSKTEYNLVLSCDMPFVSTELMDYLSGQIEDYDIVAAVHGEETLEPLCGCYSKSVVGVLENQVAEGNYKLRDVFRQVRFKTVVIDASLPFYHDHLFFNINRPEDLNL
jgi:molybdopterin-guanine dinucleotide biosynthesis protein A